MQSNLLRYRRQDRRLKLGVASVVVAIGTLFAAPVLLDRPGHGDIPLFKPHRPDIVAGR